MSMAAERWMATVAAWAQAQPDIRALVQIGSRVQPGATPDQWSDFDYQVITSRPGRYLDGRFTSELGECWAHGAEQSFGNVVKVKAVYDQALEADFVILRQSEVRLAMLALRWPKTSGWWPRRLQSGVRSLRIVAGPGWKVIKGGPRWERRYRRVAPLATELTAREFDQLCGRFWVEVVWTAKKAQRGEFMASQRGLHLFLIEDCFRLYEAAAKAAGRPAWPEGRRAEQWLGDRLLAPARVASAPDRGALLKALGQVAGTFGSLSAEMASQRGWPIGDYSRVAAWLKALAAAAP